MVQELGGIHRTASAGLVVLGDPANALTGGWTIVNSNRDDDESKQAEEELEGKIEYLQV